LIILWNQSYIISFELDKGWEESSLLKTIYPLTGNNVEIVPAGEKGYVIDSSCSASVMNGNVFSNTYFKALKVNKGDIFQASVYCYVSKDFNGDSVKILAEGAVHGYSESYYKIFDSKNDNPQLPQNLIYNGNFELGTTNWFPEADSTTFTIIETPFGNGIRVSRTNGDGGDFSLMYKGRPIIYYTGHCYRLRFKFKVEKGGTLPFSIGWWVNDANQGFLSHFLPLTIRNLNDGWKEATCTYKFKETHSDLPTFLNSLQDYSVVDIANVEMTDLDWKNTIPYFVDQLNVKGTWQKLKIDVPCGHGKISFYLSMSKNRVPDLRSLKGYVIFARPEYMVVKKKDSV